MEIAVLAGAELKPSVGIYTYNGKPSLIFIALMQNRKKTRMTMNDLIRRRDAVSRMSDLLLMELQDQRLPTWNEVYRAMNDVSSAEPERKWIPVTEKLPEDKTWYLGIFKESDTGYCISIPFVCYYAGRKTMITTKDYWILRGYDDIYFSEYYRNLECAAWMPLPEPWRWRGE